MPYNPDLAALSVEEYKDLLHIQYLLPGRRILLQNLDGTSQPSQNRALSTSLN